jgi:hypothetical protein
MSFQGGSASEAQKFDSGFDGHLGHFHQRSPYTSFEGLTLLQVVSLRVYVSRFAESLPVATLHKSASTDSLLPPLQVLEGTAFAFRSARDALAADSRPGEQTVLSSCQWPANALAYEVTSAVHRCA